MEIRPFRTADRHQVLSILERSLGWLPDDQHERFFHWKHTANPFGTSPAWVADDAGTIAGFRTFMRWEFTFQGRTVRAVRAVDTATHPDYRGLGIFSDLTRHGLEEMRSDGVEFVFNTPNDQSRPGYLKMGWEVVGRVPVRVRPSGPVGLLRLGRSRRPADLWSLPCEHGDPAPEVVADEAAVRSLLRARPTGHVLSTRRSPEYLAWRYSFPGLRYRAVTPDGSAADGLVVFRLRRRGQAIEAAIAEVLVPGDDTALARRLVADVVAGSGADYGVVLGSAPSTAGLLPLPRQGPVLTWRRVASAAVPPPLGAWALTLGDIELF